MDDDEFSLSEDQQARWEAMLDSLQGASDQARAQAPPPEEGSLNPESPDPPSEDVIDAEVQEAVPEAPESPQDDPPPPDESEVQFELPSLESESGGFGDVPPPDEPEVSLPEAVEPEPPEQPELPKEEPDQQQPEPVEDDTQDLRQAVEGLFEEGESWAEGVTSGLRQDYTAADFTEEDRLDRAMQENMRPSF